MILCDVNVLVYAYDRTAERHAEYRAWLSSVLDGDETYGVSELILSSVVRIMTNPRVFSAPAAPADALAFAAAIRDRPQAAPVMPGPRHWGLFDRLCRSGNARGNLVADAYLAALAIESGCEWITTDRDFARFPGLRWRHPLAA